MTKRSTIFINFMTICNYSCIFCANRFNDCNNTMISYQDFLNIADNLDEYDVVDITGSGEITCHPDFAKIIALITSKNKKVRIVTNGSNIHKYFDIFLHTDFSEFIISLNSLDPIIYKKLTGGNLEVVLNNIAFLHKNRPELKKVFSFVITAYNFHEIKAYIDFGKKYNATISCLGLTPTLQQYYSSDLKILPTDENKQKLVELRQYADQQEVTFSCFNFDSQRDSSTFDINKLSETIKSCHWVNDYTFIEQNGNVGVCCWNKLNLGNIKQQKLSDIYNGEKYKDLCRCINKGDLKYCKNCRMFG